ncbi:MAG: hypothetical protein DI536_08250 [Archangium gephyra]|uniref:Fascin domain-containing protein n=1 Tax=Archangium gephyra TaxID=48 RepID=A0A2W5TPZ4_9BACT|nr:MAG: hypothetical protein DI536_08250 [Archangium gephyra]
MRRKSVVSGLVLAVVCVVARAAEAQSFYTVNLRASNGQYVVAEWGGEREVKANRNAAGAWERFVLIDLNGGELNAGDPVRVRAQNGKYVAALAGAVNAQSVNSTTLWQQFVISKSNGTTGRIYSGDGIRLRAWDGFWVTAEGGGGDVLKADRSVAGPWEAFSLTIVSRASTDPSPLDPTWVSSSTLIYKIVTMRVANGHYVVAEWGGNREVKADRTVPGAWERFVVTDLSGGQLVSGDIIRIRAQNGAYVVAENGLVNANRGSAGLWELFRIVKAWGGTGVINSGDQVNLQAWDGRWLVAELGGGAEVKADRTATGAWEAFTLNVLTSGPIDPSPLGEAWTGGPSTPPAPFPPMPAGLRWVGEPQCSPQTVFFASRVTDPNTYYQYCCKPTTGASGTAHCPVGNVEFSPDCRQYTSSVPGVRFMQPWGCVAPE